MTQYVQIVVPKFVLDKECHHWTDGTQEAASIGHSVNGQVRYDICALVILLHFRSAESCIVDILS